MSTGPLSVQRDAYVVDLPDGVELVTGRGRTFLGGAAVRGWVSRLLPALDGRRSLEEALANANASQRDTARRVVSVLCSAGVLGDAGPQRFTPEHRSIAVLGPQEYADRLREGFALAGADEVSMAAPATRPIDIPDVDVLVHVFARSARAEADAVALACREAGVMLIQVALDGATALWCPQRTVEWADARARLAGLDAHPASGRVAAATSPAAPTILANMVVRDIVGRRANKRARPEVVEVDLTTGIATTHPIRSHPFTSPVRQEDGAGFLRRMAALAQRPAMTQQEFSEAAVTLMDSRVGLFSEIRQGAMAQLPLKVSASTVADPVGLLRDGRDLPVVIEADLDFAQARRQVGMRALATYASLMIDPRRLVGVEPAVDPWSAIEDLRLGRMTASVRALDLLDGRIALIGAGTAVPALAAATEPYAAPVGTGVGLSWRAAVADGLLQHCTRLVVDSIARAAGSGQTFDRIDIAATGGSARVRRALIMLDGCGRAVEIFDVTSTLGVPSMICVSEGVAVACGCAATYEQALEAGLLATLQTEQGCRATLDMEFGAALRSATSRPLPDPDPLTVEEITRRLAAAGQRPLIVPLDHDPQLTAALSSPVRVVLDAG